MTSEGTEENLKNLGQYILSLGQNLKPGHAEYEVEALNVQPHHKGMEITNGIMSILSCTKVGQLVCYNISVRHIAN